MTYLHNLSIVALWFLAFGSLASVCFFVATLMEGEHAPGDRWPVAVTSFLVVVALLSWTALYTLGALS